MNPHVIMLAIVSHVIEWFRLLQCRRAYCLLSVVNYTNGLIIASWLFGAHGDVLDLLYCIASCLFGIAVTALYLNTPLLMIPDVIYKMTISFCALFYAIQELDTGADGAPCHLLLVVAAVVLQFTENYVLFLSLSAKQLEMQQLVQRQPPPNYDQLSVLERCQQSGLRVTAKLTQLQQTNEITRPETPPPCYELAVEALKASSQQRS
ncbi:hypothetical protein NECAME_06314 [Necator americanus]|uniref:Uncharacterized protein n=1 Tax=Necator americanus TaxID=51031 RepID=W2TX16_NECAM|nr:hypothetical protein NECAME_06314 [Necator americanus]ETN85611.1 hypothetical protein NECAME_06314 [Necator americanus]